MYIRQVTIINFRAFSFFQVDLTKTTVIAGENESGKSSFFRALSLPLGQNEINFSQRSLKVSDINIDSIYQFYKSIVDGDTKENRLAKVPKVSVEVEFCSPDDEYQESLLGKWISPGEDDQTYKLRYEFAPKNDEDLLSAVESMLEGAQSEKDAMWFSFPVEFYEYKVTSANNGKQISFNELKRVAVNVIDAERDDFSESASLKANSLLTRMLITKLDSKDKAGINSAYQKFFTSVEGTKSFKKIFDQDESFENIADHIEAVECIPNLPDLKNILSNITLKTGDKFLYQKGLGERNLILILLLFEFYRFNSGYFNLCCVEEPESHLSVNNLRFATDYISKRTKASGGLLQTLITTHEPSVINKLELQNLVVFSGGKAIGFGSIKSGIRDYLKKRPNFDILKLLFSDRVVLVEGVSEELLINAHLSLKGGSLNRVEVLVIGQKGFRTFLDIWLKVSAGVSHKKIGVIRDFDNQINAKKEHDKYDTNYENVCVRTTSGYTLEDDIAAAGDNRKKISKIFGCGDSIEEVSDALKNDKALAMAKLSDAMIDAENPVDITMPSHIAQVLSFVQ